MKARKTQNKIQTQILKTSNKNNARVHFPSCFIIKNGHRVSVFLLFIFLSNWLTIKMVRFLSVGVHSVRQQEKRNIFALNDTQAQRIPVGFASLIITLSRNSTAFFKPSSIVIKLSSCSIERTLSYPQRRRLETKSLQNVSPLP